MGDIKYSFNPLLFLFFSFLLSMTLWQAQLSATLSSAGERAALMGQEETEHAGQEDQLCAGRPLDSEEEDVNQADIHHGQSPSPAASDGGGSEQLLQLLQQQTDSQSV